ncbi:MAG: hypothetical protein ACE5HS_14345 [bacterium]
MLKIIIAEIRYNQKLIFGCFSFILLVGCYELAISEIRIGYTLIASYMLTVFWNIHRNREKRDYQVTRLPLSNRQLALARLVIIVLACLSVSMIYFIIYLLFNFRIPQEPIKLIAYPGIILVGFTIYFVIRDLWRDSFKVLFLHKSSKIRGVVIVMVLVVNVLTIYAFVLTVLQKNLDKNFLVVIHYLDKINLLAEPPATEFQLIIFVLASFVLAFTTVFSFGWRKSYLG